jgi:hypothetical protein
MMHVDSNAIALALWLVGVAIAVGSTFITFSPAAAGARLVYEGAYLDPSFTSAFEASKRRRRRLAAVSRVAFVTTVVAVLRFTHLDPILSMAPLLAVALALQSADQLRAAGREFVVPNSGSAVARVRRVVLTDYVPARAQVLTWIAVAIVVTAAGRVLWHRHELAGPAVVSVTVGATTMLAVAVYAAWFGRAMCERPTPAVDASHLYLQDAIRASALELVYSILQLNAVLFCIGISNSSYPALGLPFDLAMLGASLAIRLASLTVPAGQFRKRLWGTLTPGQVLLPGQPVPPLVGARA